MVMCSTSSSYAVMDEFVRDCSGLNFKVAHELICKLRSLGLRPNCSQLVLVPPASRNDNAHCQAVVHQRSCVQRGVTGGTVGSTEGLWCHLPTDMLSSICCLLGTRDILVACLVCDTWKKAIGSTVSTLVLPPKLTSLQLQHMLWWAASCCTALRAINLCRCATLRDAALPPIMAAVGTTLQGLDLSGCIGLSDVGIAAVASNCRALLSLDISSCTLLTDDSLAYIANGCVALQRLNACGCVRMTDMGVQAVAAGCRHLRQVNFGWCELISGVGLQQLAVHCTALVALDLCGCLQVQDSCLVALASHCPALSFLSLHCCRLITEAGIMALAQHARNLQYVNISGCRRVTEAALQALIDVNPHLHTCKAKRSVIVGGCVRLLTVSCACPKTLLGPQGSYHISM